LIIFTPNQVSPAQKTALRHVVKVSRKKFDRSESCMLMKSTGYGLLLEGVRKHEVRPDDGEEAVISPVQIWGRRKMDRITTSMTTMKATPRR